MGQERDERPACVVLCAGSDCAKDERTAFRKLRDVVRDSELEVVHSRCLGVCHGPVAVIDRAGEEPVVLRRIRRGAARRVVVELARTGRAQGAGEISVAGKKARRAIRRAAKAS
ncbi:MAG: hypothetical protein AAGA99_08080 [Actinomycetota bacterium]